MIPKRLIGVPILEFSSKAQFTISIASENFYKFDKILRNNILNYNWRYELGGRTSIHIPSFSFFEVF